MHGIKPHKLAFLIIVALIVSGILACQIGGEPAKPTITITAPTSGAQVEVGEVNVLSSASDAKGIARVELSVDGALYRTDANPDPEGGTSFALVQTWTASDPGMHTLSVTAYNVDGLASDPWAVTVEVVEEGEAVPTSTTAPGVPTATSAPPPPPTNTPAAAPTDTVAPEPTDTPEPEPTDTPAPLPDLFVDALAVTPPNPEWGGSVGVSVDVANRGDAPSGPYSVLWRYGSGDFDVCEWNQPSLPPMNGGTLHCTVDEIYASYDTVATVDWRDEVDESNEDNNSMQFRVDVGPSPPDLYISEIRLDPESPQQGSPVHVGIRINNGGGTAAGAFKALWRSAGPTVGCEWNVGSLAAGASGWQECSYTYSGWNPNYTTTGVVDVDDDVDESNEDNNELVLMVNVRPD